MSNYKSIFTKLNEVKDYIMQYKPRCCYWAPDVDGLAGLGGGAGAAAAAGEGPAAVLHSLLAPAPAREQRPALVQ